MSISQSRVCLLVLGIGIRALNASVTVGIVHREINARALFALHEFLGTN